MYIFLMESNNSRCTDIFYLYLSLQAPKDDQLPYKQFSHCEHACRSFPIAFLEIKLLELKKKFKST